MREAPLYIVAHDLCCWLEGRLAQDRAHSALTGTILGEAYDLLQAVAVALVFPARRRLELRRADEACLHLRVLLRVACDCQLLTPAQLESAAAELDRAGRMLGGWRRSWARTERRPASSSDSRVQGPAASASCAAGATGTQPTTVVPPTATGTTRTTTTTTTDSALRSPSPRALDIRA